MTERGKKYLSDILTSIDLIESFLIGIDSFEKYQLDFKTQSANEIQLGIVGEAVNKFKKECPDEKLKNTRRIVGFRNRIVHAYDSIDNSIVRVIVQKYLHPLKEEVQNRI